MQRIEGEYKNRIDLSETAISQVDETIKNRSYKDLHPSF